MPSVGIIPPVTTLLGENTTIELTFDNTSTSDIGYGPFIDVVLPVNGADGAAGTQEPDGIDVRGNAIYLDSSISTIVQTFPNDANGTGCVEHPLAVDSSSNPLMVCGTAGDKLVTIVLPLGSYEPDQPRATIELPIAISPKADLNYPLPVHARAGFLYGADPDDNPDTDPPIISDTETDSSAWSVTKDIEPVLIDIDKIFGGVEGETVSGENFIKKYRVEIHLGPGQTVTNMDIIDELPPNLAFTRLTNVYPSGNYTVVSTPPADTAANPPDNIIDVQFPSVTGDSNPNSPDAYIEFECFVPLLDADGNFVIDPTSGDSALSKNNAKVQGDWTPVDTRDPAQPGNAVTDPPGPEHILTDKAITAYKSVSIVTDTGVAGYSPGDVLQYTLDFQISDYFSFDDVNVTDILSDGQDLDTSFTPVLTINMDGNSTSHDFDSSNYSRVINGDGTESIIFHVSSELESLLGDSKLVGGCIPDDGTGSGNLPDCSNYNDGPTTARVVFRAIIQEDFSHTYASGDSSVDQGDILSNNVTVVGNVVSVEDNNSTTGATESDTSGLYFKIKNGSVSKDIYAINGNTNLPNPLILRPGDVITYRIRFTMPTPDVEDLILKDYVPLPVLDATELATFDDTNSSDIPPAGVAKFGPNDTFHEIYDDGSGSDYPGISTNGPENSIEFIYGNFDSTDTQTRDIDLLFSLTVKNDPFANGLSLTNLVMAHLSSTSEQIVTSHGMAQIELGEPELVITKGVSYSNNPATVIAPAPSIEPIDGNASNCDANDTLTFVITVENIGNAPAYDVTIQDHSHLDMDNCTLVSVKDGNDTTLTYSGDLFGSGLVLDNPLDENDGVPGPPYSSDTALVTFECHIKEDAKPTDIIDRGAVVVWAAGSGAEKFPAESDNATITMASPSIGKAISAVDPGPIAPNITIGDTVTYKVDVTLPEGEIPALTVEDTLPSGLQYVADSLNLNTDNFNGTFSQSPDVTVSGGTVTIQLGDVSVTADNNATNNEFSLTFEAKVIDDPANNGVAGLQRKRNTVLLDYAGNLDTIKGTATCYLGEPFLEVTKTISPSPADAGDQVTVAISVENTGTSPAFDIVISDKLDGNVFDLSSITEGTTDDNFTFSYSSPIVIYTADPGFYLDPNDSVNFSFLAYIFSDVVTGSEYLNTVSAYYSSESGNVTGERVASGNGTDALSISSISLSKALESTSEAFTTDPYVAIGEVATFIVTYNVPEGVTKGIRLKDIVEKISGTRWGQFLTNSIEILKSSDSLSCSGQFCNDALNGASANQWVSVDASYIDITDTATESILSIDLGDANNTDLDNSNVEFYQLRFKIQVLNNSVTSAGTNLVDKGAVDYQDANGNINTILTGDTTLVVAEPVPSINKSANPTSVNGGDPITFTIDICNEASGDTATSAFDWTFSDQLPDNYENISGPNIDTGSTGATVNANFTNQTLSGTIDRLDPGECVQITYSADLVANIEYSMQVTNTISVTTTSLPGDHGTADVTTGNPGEELGERTGTGGVNDLTDSSSATVAIAEPILAKKLENPKDWYPIGENATFTIIAGVPVG
ncbi:MAG: DUF11 domain-containing protein, partial [Thermodesulfobacteria bacterium]|nr:DUF11 domain-containing protein [Thermodesulfobacteriota bacterium]